MAVARHIVVLDHGQKIAEGNPTEVVANPDVIRAYLGTEYVPVATAWKCAVLTLSGVSAAYGSVPAISDVSITVGEGSRPAYWAQTGPGRAPPCGRSPVSCD